MPLYTGFIQLGAGLSVGLAGLAAGFAIGIVGDAGVRGTAQQPRLFVGMVSFISRVRSKIWELSTRTATQILILIFAEVLGLYGLIVALILNTNSAVDYTVRLGLLWFKFEECPADPVPFCSVLSQLKHTLVFIPHTPFADFRPPTC